MKLPIKFGLIAGGLSGFVLILEYIYVLPGDMPQGAYTFMFSMFNLIVASYATIYFTSRNDFKTAIPFEVGVKEGLKVGIMVGLCIGAASVIYTSFIDPMYYKVLAAEGRAQMLEMGKTEDEIEGSLSTYYMFHSWWMTIVSKLVMYIVAGLVYSMLVTWLVRKMPIHDQT